MEDAGNAGGNDGTHSLDGSRQYGSSSPIGAVTVLLWILGLALLGVTAYASWQLWSVLQTGYEPLWGHFWTAAFTLFGLAIAYGFASMLGPVLTRFRPFLRQVRSRVERVRAAAIIGDDRLAPLAAEQPEPLPASELPIGLITFGPFTPTRKHRSRSMLGWSFAQMLIIGGLTAVLAVAGAIVLPLVEEGPDVAWMRPMYPILLGMFALNTLLSILGFVVALVQRLRGVGRAERVQLAADDWGVRPLDSRHGKERQPIAWHEVRAFYKSDDLLRLQEGRIIRRSTPRQTTYTFATAERALSWTLWEDASAKQHTDSERLCRLIVTRTRLRLRDVTAFATQFAADVLESASPLLLALPDQRISIEAQQYAQAAVAAIPTSPTSPPTTRRVGATWPRWLMASRIAALGLAILAITAGMLAQGIQSFRYTDLLNQHIDREPPYYSIDFRTNDGAWPNHPATADDGSYVFRTDGYYMTGAPDGRPMEAVLPVQYGDATVELTAGLADIVPAGDIGVVVRENDDGTDKVVFTLTSSGGWALVHIHAASGAAPQRLVLMSNGQSDAVRTGKGAYNFLAVIMRGADYLCFVRDHLVGIYHDLSAQTPRQGRAGLWLGNSRAVGEFYYFAVYPAQ